LQLVHGGKYIATARYRTSGTWQNACHRPFQ